MRVWSRRRGVALTTALLCAVAAVAGAAAQGFFYMEVERDGRIYVFAIMKEYETFMKTGAMGKSITRPGAGPNGETMVFDSEDAINLYNFKHGRPGEVIARVEEKKPVMRFEWKDGKTTFESDRASLVLSNRVQIRFTEADLGDPTEDSRGSFRIRRAKTKLEGWIYNRSFTYELQLNWPDTANPLEDANFNYDLSRGRKHLMLKAGQFKVPFGRQELTSSGAQQFVDRSIVAGEFEKGRDIGVQAWGLLFNEKLDWRLGAFNGNGRTKTANDNSTFQTDARITWQPFGDVKYSEADFESGDRPLFALAAQYERNDARESTSSNDVDRHVWGGDAVFKYKGVSALVEYFRRRNRPESGAESHSKGVCAQLGVFVIPRKLELAARFATLDPSDAAGADDRTETGIAVSWYLNRHNLKLQSDFRVLEDDSNPAPADKDREARLQFQFIF